MKASGIAYSNIALCKYWGKRNEELILPFNSSISMTLDKFHTHTTVEFSDVFKDDILIINNHNFEKDTKEFLNVSKFLKIVRAMKNIETKVKIVSKNNFPTSAGLASSASGFAALAVAINKALELNLNEKQLSVLARQGSGSSSRSIKGGFVEWLKGKQEDGEDSYAQQIVDEKHWPELRMVACILSKQEKKMKSRVGMKNTVETSPMYQAWLNSVEKDLINMKKAIIDKDFTTLGKIAEHNCMKMHATMWTTKPAIIYQNKTTIELMHSIMEWREQGLECYYTMDAGPQVKILCLEKNVDILLEKLNEFEGIEDITVNSVGKNAKIVEEHLF
jgi:diphosphomevalonate decarboxylase